MRRSSIDTDNARTRALLLNTRAGRNPIYTTILLVPWVIAPVANTSAMSTVAVSFQTVVGRSTSRGEEVADRPLKPQDVTATVFRHLGIDLAQSNVWTATISTFSGFLESRNEPFVVTNTDNSANEIRIQEASGNGSNFFAFRADTSITTTRPRSSSSCKASASSARRA